jgi:hypothetical protein
MSFLKIGTLRKHVNKVSHILSIFFIVTGKIIRHERCRHKFIEGQKVS